MRPSILVTRGYFLVTRHSGEEMRLTKRAIDGMEYSGGTDYRWDESLPGFGVRVYPSGKKSFVISYRVKGRKRFMVLGAYGVLTLDQARRRARRELARVADGIDPSAERQDERQAPTMADLAERYMREHAPKKKAKSQREDRRMWEQKILPVLRTRKVADIERSDVERLHAKMQDTPYAANRVVALLSKAFNLAESWNWRPLHTNPTTHVERYEEKGRARKREVMLKPKQIRVLMEAIAAERREGTDPVPLAIIEAAFWLGWRLKSELLPLKWVDLDLEHKVARLWNTKTVTDQDFEYRALPDPVVELFRSLPRDPDNPYVFPGIRPGTHRTTVRKVWYRVRKRAGLTEIAHLGDYRAHDLRHNAVSWLLASGSSLKMAGQVVGHRSQRSTEVYSHFITEHLANAANAGSAAMQAAAQEAEE